MSESDGLSHIARLYQEALALFEGDGSAATEWLAMRQPGLGGAVPLELARTETGRLEVERLLLRLKEGVFS